VGLEPTVLGSVGERLMHYTTSYLRFFVCKHDFLNTTATNYYYKCHIIEQYIQFVYYLPVESAVH